MFDFPQPATALHQFAHENNQPLQSAALLLGGPGWLRRTQKFLEDLAQAHSLTRRIIREAAAVLSLLKLDNVNDLESIEAACFAAVDPAAPYIAEICLLTEAFEAALRQIEASAKRPVDLCGSQHKE